jgi:hypothetical protein
MPIGAHDSCPGSAENHRQARTFIEENAPPKPPGKADALKVEAPVTIESKANARRSSAVSRRCHHALASPTVFSQRV